MRHLFLLLVAFVFPVASKLQSQTLQFSQVLLISTVQTVPANKVWKVESYTQNNSGANLYHQIVVNSNTSIVGSTNYTLHNHPFPMWLPAGTTLAAGANVINISVIEFTVLP
ncbi:MAG: hypothetical protein FJZ75_06260 [Bacteroidetes bacterium]|nr:hypothetical protein [Bacteroidota bacterium]